MASPPRGALLPRRRSAARQRCGPKSNQEFNCLHSRMQKMTGNGTEPISLERDFAFSAPASILGHMRLSFKGSEAEKIRLPTTERRSVSRLAMPALSFCCRKAGFAQGLQGANTPRVSGHPHVVLSRRPLPPCSFNLAAPRCHLND